MTRKKIYMYDRITLDFLEEYESLIECATDNDLSKSTMATMIIRNGGYYATLEALYTDKNLGEKIKVGMLND